MNPDQLESTTPEDPYLNFLWWPYPPAAPAEDKLRSANLLFHSFDVAGLGDRAGSLIRTIREAIGLFRTVWGIKWLGGRLVWEFYFYDYARRGRGISATRVLEAIRPHVRCDVPIDEGLPYFMFSIDFSADVLAGDRDPGEVHIYIGNPGSAVPSGIAYALRPDGPVLENFYYFFDAERQLQATIEKISCSACADVERVAIEWILWPELRACANISVANKQRNDAVYFSGVDVHQLLFFLKRLHYPPEIVGFVEEYRARLDHLRYDIGFDYVAQGPELRIVKSGYYGVF